MEEMGSRTVRITDTLTELFFLLTTEVYPL